MHRRQASATLRKIRRESRQSGDASSAPLDHGASDGNHLFVDDKGNQYDFSAFAGTFGGGGAGRQRKSEVQPPPTATATETAALIPSKAPQEGKLSRSGSRASSISVTPGPGLHSWRSDLHGVWDLISGSPVNVLLVVWPFAIWAHLGHWSPALVFSLNFLVMVPLAKLLGDTTEILSLHLGETIGGLVNATFGNAVEVVIALFALRANQIRVVQASMIGSILSNLLLVLGCCFTGAGMFYKESHFNAVGASANSSLLMLSALAMIIPTPFAMLKEDQKKLDEDGQNTLLISRVTACFLLFMYMQLLVFQLRTHLYLFEVDDDEEEPELSAPASGLLLGATTAIIAMHSEFLVGSIDGLTESSGLSKSFVGVVLLPVVGNAVEHVTAVSVAMKGKMELAMGVAVGSATQVSMFVVPVIVLAGWAMDRDMSLNFPIFEVSVYLMSIIIVYGIISDGKSNWLEGTSLLTAYILIAVAMWFQ